MKPIARGLLVLALAGLVLAACSNTAGVSHSGPRFQVVSAHWLLCPENSADLRLCCPQPADPRRCVVPGPSSAGSVNPSGAPTELVAFARFKNAGFGGTATATFSAHQLAEASCSTPVPYTAAGGSATAWCSLGVALEPGVDPAVHVIDEVDSSR